MSCPGSSRRATQPSPPLSPRALARHGCVNDDQCRCWSSATSSTACRNETRPPVRLSTPVRIEILSHTLAVGYKPQLTTPGAGHTHPGRPLGQYSRWRLSPQQTMSPAVVIAHEWWRLAVMAWYLPGGGSLCP